LKPPFFKKIRQTLEYGAFLAVSAAVAPLSAGTVFRLGRILGGISYLLGARRKTIGRVNLDIAFGDSKPPEERNRILRESFNQLAVSLLQCLWLDADPRARLRKLIDGEPEGLDTLRECIGRGRGVFLLMAHYGNWEAAGVLHGTLGIAPLTGIVRKLDNPLLEKRALSFRTRSGNRMLYKNESTLKIVRAVKNNQCVVVMMDQNMARSGVFVDFFGKKAATARSIASLSLATGAAILPFFSHPNGDGGYKIKYGPEIAFAPTGDKEKDILDLTRKCEAFLEAVIEKRPEPWMWTHRRWKTRPPEERGERPYP
jgi:KDO2-lipid IV(A) lauroyltransferase